MGGWPEAGEIVGIELVGVRRYERHTVPFTDKQVKRRHGEPIWPYAAEGKIRVGYRYQEA